MSNIPDILVLGTSLSPLTVGLISVFVSKKRKSRRAQLSKSWSHSMTPTSDEAKHDGPETL